MAGKVAMVMAMVAMAMRGCEEVEGQACTALLSALDTALLRLLERSQACCALRIRGGYRPSQLREQTGRLRGMRWKLERLIAAERWSDASVVAQALREQNENLAQCLNADSSQCSSDNEDQEENRPFVLSQAVEERENTVAKEKAALDRRILAKSKRMIANPKNSLQENYQRIIGARDMQNGDIKIDTSIERDGIQESLDMPYIFVYSKESNQEREYFYIILKTCKIPLRNGKLGRLTRLSNNTFVLVRSEEDLIHLASAKNICLIASEDSTKQMHSRELTGALTSDAYLESVERPLQASAERLASPASRRHVLGWGGKRYARGSCAAQASYEFKETVVQVQNILCLVESVNAMDVNQHPTPNFDLVSSTFCGKDEDSGERWGEQKHDLDLLLSKACIEGNSTLAEKLLQAGASVNAHIPVNVNMTALHCAAQAGWLNLVDLLLRHGADVNVTDGHGQTALHRCAEKGGKYIVDIPIAFTANLPKVSDVNASDISFTFVPEIGGDWRHQGSLAIARRLMASGIDLWAKDNVGKTAERLADENGRYQTRDFLRRRMGADEDGNLPAEKAGMSPEVATLESVLDGEEAEREWRERAEARRKQKSEEDVAKRELLERAIETGDFATCPELQQEQYLQRSFEEAIRSIEELQANNQTHLIFQDLPANLQGIDVKAALDKYRSSEEIEDENDIIAIMEDVERTLGKQQAPEHNRFR
eukprot:766034-Hanusia_phi.AAC.4